VNCDGEQQYELMRTMMQDWKITLAEGYIDEHYGTSDWKVTRGEYVTTILLVGSKWLEID
jgi:hypothetical protein